MKGAPIESISNAGPESIIVQRVMQWLERDSATMQTVTSFVQRTSSCREGRQAWVDCSGGVRRDGVPYSHSLLGLGRTEQIRLHFHLVDAFSCRSCR